MVCTLETISKPDVFVSNELVDQDQMWGLLSRQLGRDPSLVKTDSAVTIIRQELLKPGVKKWINGEVQVHTLRTCRDWKAHILAHSPVQFAHCLCLASFGFYLLYLWLLQSF